MLLLSFVPMFLIASSFYYMNRADPDCGTTFSWITRAMGPSTGWVGGWAVCTTGIIVVGSLAQVAVYYSLDLLNLDSLRDSRFWETVLTIGVIALVTLICVLGTELSARVQRVMILAQVGALLLFAVVALIKVAAGDAPAGSIDVEWSWFSPFAVDSTQRPGGGHAERSVHLLGLGERRQPERGDRGLDVGSRPGRRRQHGRAARDLCRDDRRGGRLRRARSRRRVRGRRRSLRGARPPTCSATGWTGSSCWRSSPRRSPRPRPRSCPGRARRCRWPVRGRFPSRWAACIRASSPRTSRRS